MIATATFIDGWRKGDVIRFQFDETRIALAAGDRCDGAGLPGKLEITSILPSDDGKGPPLLASRAV